MKVEDAGAASIKKHSTWRWLRRFGSVAFLIGIIALLIFFARRVEWHEVFATLRGFRITTLLAATAAASVSFLVYSTFDLFGRRAIGHRLPRRLTMTTAFICYAFTQTLTAWVGGIALRYRLYSRFGLKKAAIAQIFGISALTNWIGYLLLASIVCIAGLIAPPQDWSISHTSLRFIGLLLLVPVLAYVGCCARFPNRGYRAFGQDWKFPPLRIGLLQVAAGSMNWMSMAAVIFILFRQQVDYVTVLGILLLSSIAALIAHIPAGLGVLEALFVTLLAGEVGRNQVLATLICYRAIYYLLPLLPAAAVYAMLEVRAVPRK